MARSARSAWTIGEHWLTRVVRRDEPAPAPSWSAPTLALILGLLAVWRASILGFSWLLDRVGEANCGFGVPPPWKYSACWDTQSYQIVAASGYHYTPGEPSPIAFFPLYPLLMRWANTIVPGPGDVLAGVVVGHVALAIAAVYVFRVVRIDYDEAVAWRTLGFLLVFPSAFFFSAAYSESLFLLGLAGSLYHARRGQWLAAGLFGAAASATKLVGVVLVVPLLVEALAQRSPRRERWPAIAGVALAPMGATGYFAWLQWRFGDFRVFFEAQQNWIRESFQSVLFMGIERLLGDVTTMLIYYPPVITPFATFFILFDTTLLLLFIAAGVMLWSRARASYGALILAACVVLSLSGNPQSMNRYLVPFFPVFILLARIRSDALRNTLFLIFSLGLAMETYFFVNALWAG